MELLNSMIKTHASEFATFIQEQFMFVALCILRYFDKIIPYHGYTYIRKIVTFSLNVC